MKFLLITTGGTIASVAGEHGFAPGVSGEQLLRMCPQLMGFEHEVSVVDLFAKDSSNMHPNDWLVMAEHIRHKRGDADAVIMLHGTDTRAWPGAALSYLLHDVAVPVVLTGSMLTPDAPDSDVADNIYAAFQFAMQLAMYKRKGVAIAFADTLIHGAKTTKIDSHRKKAFLSVDYPLLGEMKERETHKIAWLTSKVPAFLTARPWGEKPVFETDIALLPIFPGMKARFIDHVVDSAPKAVVLEGYGSGGVPFMEDSLLPAIERGIAKGVPFFLHTQSPFGGTDPTIYEVGQRALALGVVSALDLTREALITKLMLLLPLYSGDALGQHLSANLCDDVTS